MTTQSLTLLLALTLLLPACDSGGDGGGGGSDGPSAAGGSPGSLTRGLVLALAQLEKGADGKWAPQPARAGFLTFTDGAWSYRTLDDPASNVFHKVMVYEPRVGEARLLTAGGTRAILKLWSASGDEEVLWEKDFGGKFSRMRDVEVADLHGDGSPSLAVATHDQGVVAVVRPGGDHGFVVEELDGAPETIVHEIEVGDLDGDGTVEVYATPSAPNKLDGTPQPGTVVRYVPARGEGPTVVAELGDRHAKEILVGDVDADGRDELYVSVEAVAGGQVEIRRYEAGTDAAAGPVIAELPDKLCRFLTAGDIDGDGRREMVAATHKSGLWLLSPIGNPNDSWVVKSIDRASGGFEHASILSDLDGDGADELYVASDHQREVRRYVWRSGSVHKEVIYTHPAGTSLFTWNIMPVPVELIPK